ncbi:hypothetical protein QYE76_068429 [Lolium multiflorum]|uniref:Retrotransposon protein, putative, Ty1-copia subclass n=1 Tax=Lolium multiflorum TaxID=4521 RepID=A0AAD8SES7_LOLMU|nr:hypothetical protein QYE76_068429 [Lolium multiflorum]
MEHWTAVKNILKYLKRTKDMFLCYGGDQELVVTSYTDASWNSDPDDSKSQSGYVFILNGAAVSWASSTQCTVAKSSTESEYIAASEASSEAVWMKRFIVELGVVPSALDPFVIYCDNMGAIANAQEPRSHKRLKHIKLRYHSIREYIEDGESGPEPSLGAETTHQPAKKPKITKPPPLNSKKAERERLKMLATAGKRSRPIIPGAPIPTTATTRTTSQEPITKYMKKSPAVGPPTPAPPSTSHTAPPKSPPQADQSPPPAANTPPEVIPVSSEKMGGEDPKAKGPETEVQGQGEAEVTSSEKIGAGAGDVVVFPKNFGDPADLTSTPKAYATKFFNKLTEAEKWELEQDLLNAMLNNAWGKPDAATSEIQDFKKDVGQFFDKLICKQKEQQALHYELHKNIALQRRVTLGQAENIRTLKNENAELNKQLADAQGASSSLATTSSELENLRSSYQELETKLKEAEQKKERARSSWRRKTPSSSKKRGNSSEEKCDSKTIKRQQKELNGLRKYMETAERHWDLLTENILEPLGYPEKRRNLFPRDDLLSLAGDDCKDLISASWKICHNLSLKKSRTCDVGAVLGAISGYDTRIARRIRHEEFYDKVVLPADEPLEAKLRKERDTEVRPAESGTQFTWTSSKDAPQEETKDSAASSEDEGESDEDVSSPAEGTEGKTPEGNTSPDKED